MWGGKLRDGSAVPIFVQRLSHPLPLPENDVLALEPNSGFSRLKFENVSREGPRYILERKTEKRSIFGSVFVAWDVRLKMPVVIKFYSPTLGDQAAFFNFLELEAKTMDRIYSATGGKVPRIFDLIRTSDGEMGMVMEYLDNEHWELLRDRVEKGKMPFEDVVEIMDRLANLVDVLAANGLYHADLKLSNLFIGREEGKHQIKLFDFGTSTWAFKHGSGDMGVGTPEYISSRRSKTGDVNIASEKFAMAVMIVRMLSGNLEWVNGSGKLLRLSRDGVFSEEVALVLRSVLNELPKYLRESAGDFLRRLRNAGI